MNIANSASVDQMVETLVQKSGGIDVLVNSAAIDNNSYDSLPDFDMEDYVRVMDVNSKDILLVSRAVAKVMGKQTPREFNIPTGGTRELNRGVLST